MLFGFLRKSDDRRFGALLPAALVLFALSASAEAQLEGVGGRYHPLNQMTPPGIAGYWAAVRDPSLTRYYQPVRVELPHGGTVTFFSGPARRPVKLTAPAMAGVAVGHVYRLRISDLPEHPGIELFPSIEILDRLHPPAGKLYEFPVPIQITAEEIQFALAGNLVTKVMYLEQPQLAIPRRLSNPIGVNMVPAYRNAMAEADRRGRPMVIIRMGGRLPDPLQRDPEFFGTGAKITLPPSQTQQTSPPESSPAKGDGVQNNSSRRQQPFQQRIPRR